MGFRNTVNQTLLGITTTNLYRTIRGMFSVERRTIVADEVSTTQYFARYTRYTYATKAAYDASVSPLSVVKGAECLLASANVDIPTAIYASWKGEFNNGETEDC